MVSASLNKRPEIPSNVVSLSDYREREELALRVVPAADPLKGARVIADLATSIGIDLRIALAIQRGDIPPVA